MTNHKKKRSYDVICVGSATLDCFVQLPCRFRDIKGGSKILIEDIRLNTGGGGTNVAVGLSRLGMKTGFIGEVGDDLSARMIKHDLKDEMVDFLVKHHSRHQTAYSVVVEGDKERDRAILVYKGASSYLLPYEIPKNLKTDCFYFASVMGSSFKTMERIAAYARKNNIDVYFNPSSYMIRQGMNFLKKIIRATTIMAVNKQEAQLLLNTESRDLKKLLEGMRTLGPKICIITDGKNGVTVTDGNKIYKGKTHKTKIIDTTGAGDAFGAGFLSGMIIKKDKELNQRIRFAIKLGLENAESVIGKTGAKTGLLKKRESKIYKNMK